MKLSEELLYSLVISSDGDPFLRAELPAAIGSGTLGDPDPLLRLAAAVTGEDTALAPPVLQEDDGVNAARLLSTQCMEGRLPWAPDSPLAGREAAAVPLVEADPSIFRPFSPSTVLSTSISGLCLPWPQTPRPEGVPQRGPNVPVLAISGRDDLRTPLEDGRRTAAQYPAGAAKVLGVPDVGHSVLANDLSGCAVSRLTAFLAGQPVNFCQRGPRKPLLPAAVIPAEIDDLRPARGSSGLPGRTATAVSATIYGLIRATAALPRDAKRVGGLRGGYASLDDGALLLRDVEWVEGVRVSGVLRRRSARLEVGGPEAAAGRLVLRPGGALRGMLGGERVVIRQLGT